MTTKVERALVYKTAYFDNDLYQNSSYSDQEL